MATASASGRGNQKLRTRKALLQAGAALMKQGRKPTLDEVAEAALVSRATAYRYFASVDALLLEAALDVVAPDPERLFPDGASSDPVARLERVDDALHEMILANEAQLRMMLASSLELGVRGDDSGPPRRQNRRSALIDAALQPARADFRPATAKTLARALALVVGTEAMVVFKDVLRVDDAEARRVKRWMIRALVDAARRPRADAARSS